jgi:hypothetical protein
MADINGIVTIDRALLLKLLQRAVHTADCELVRYYPDAACDRYCTCGTLGILADAAADIPEFNMRDCAGGSSTPDWLLLLVPRKHPPYERRRTYRPGLMSDG